MNKTYAILGAGMQGTAAAFDLARFAEPARILMGDRSLDVATHNARRVNELVGRAVCEPVQVDALNPASLGTFLQPVDVLLSCVPYWMHPKVASVAIATGTSMVDMGGDTEVSLETLKLDDAAQAAGVTIIPDTGLAPGLVNDLGSYLLESFDEAHSVRLYCGGLPQNPKPPFNYKLVFNIEGLVTEYVDEAVSLKDGQITLTETLSELETLEFDGLGTMEAFTTSGGTSTAPHTFQGKVRDYVYKTVRFPGHCERMRIFKDFGFWNTEPIQVDGQSVVPREVFHTIMADALKDPNDKDQVVVRAVGQGLKDAALTTIQMDIHEKQCEVTGFSAMEKLTGFSTAIYAREIALGNVAKGCVRYELAMTGARFVDEIQRRGIVIKMS